MATTTSAEEEWSAERIRGPIAPLPSTRSPNLGSDGSHSNGSDLGPRCSNRPIADEPDPNEWFSHPSGSGRGGLGPLRALLRASDRHRPLWPASGTRSPSQAEVRGRGWETLEPARSKRLDQRLAQTSRIHSCVGHDSARDRSGPLPGCWDAHFRIRGYRREASRRPAARGEGRVLRQVRSRRMPEDPGLSGAPAPIEGGRRSRYR